MKTDKPQINPYLLERQLEAFREFVKSESGVSFVSFASNPYTESQEGYKYDIHHTARDALAFHVWKKSDIGSGVIVESIISAIEIPDSNLVPWNSRFGEDARPHQPLYKAAGDPQQLRQIEECFFNLFHDENDEQSFNSLIGLFGKKYSLLAYFFFLKDRSRYLPIATTFFDTAFAYLGANFITARRCSWENYSSYIDLIGQIKTLLTEHLSGEVSLLDAHSFAWMLADQMEKAKKLANVDEYLDLSPTEREAVVKARIGQGRFRVSLIDYWSGCAVTNCKEVALLRASHIKPWANGNIEERLSLYNGLLLSPSLDEAFDSGFISFEDEGRIIFSKKLGLSDAKSLGFHSEMRLKRIDPKHKNYLAYHREHILK